MIEPTAITVRTASRMPVGKDAFQEVGVSLSFSIRDGSSLAEAVAAAGTALEESFAQLWAVLDGPSNVVPAR